MSAPRRVRARPLVAGRAEGEALVSTEPLSFWGGYDPRSGEIIDRRHPLSGAIASGRILVLPSTRGSSTTSAILLEAVRSGTAPAAVLSQQVDAFLALTSIVADEMYGKPIPIFTLEPDDLSAFRTGQWVRLHPNGEIEIR